jgi:hypothetical protein
MRHLRKALTWIADTRPARWCHRHRLLAWRLNCGAMVWLVILWPTPRMLAILIGFGVLLLLEQSRQLRAIKPVVIQHCENGIRIQQGAATDIEIAEAVRGALNAMITEQEVAVAPPVIISVAQGEGDDA